MMTNRESNTLKARKKVRFAPEDKLNNISEFHPDIPCAKRRIKRKGKYLKKHINLLYCNINGVRGKIRSLKDVMTMEETDIAMLTETKGPPPAMEGYTWYSKERRNGKGGGVAIAVRNNLTSFTSTPDINDWNEMEIIWIKIYKPGRQQMYFGCYYGLQEKVEKEHIITQFEHLKTQVARIQHKGSIVLAGDFNAKMRNEESGHIQEASRNGKVMEQFLQETKLINANQLSKTGKWTRVNRHNTTEKSIIDYIITNQEGMNNLHEVEIDETGTKRLKNLRSESDHNTITAKMTTNHTKKEIKTSTRWNINDNTNWELYNTNLRKTIQNKGSNYSQIEEMIRQALKKSVGLRTFRIDNDCKPREPEEVKNLRRKKKEKRKEFEESTQETRITTLEDYYEAQRELRKAVEEAEKNRIRRTIEEITKSRDKNAIWKVRKKLIGKKRIDYDTIDEDGNTITDPEEAKEHIANYFEDLYQAREADEEAKEWTNEILKANEITKKNTNEGERLPEITEKEMELTKKKLKRRKSCGPDNIPNEAIIHADKDNTNELRRIFNRILKENNIPEAWKNGRIITIYKGKGIKGKCSSERGISISSNMGKVFERIINERTKEHLNISDMQGGGKKGANTVDHILALKEAIKKGKDCYVAFLDVTKAYDKAWADGIMYVLGKEGIDNKLWPIIKELNENLTAIVETKHGNTRPITMKDNIRQGGVLSVIMYAILMDEIAKEIEANKLGITMKEGEKIGCLLWMDDVALIAESKDELQKMLDIADKISTKYRIKFGEEKSKIIKIGKKLTQTDFHLGQMNLGYCDKYKYLGVIFTNKNNMDEHIKEIKKKSEAAFNTAMAIAGSTDLKNMELKVIWELIETCILPIITYGWEATNPRRCDEKQLKQIVDNLIKRVLITPTGTPWEPLYIETGIQEIGLTIQKNRLNYMEKIETSQSSILKKIREDQNPKGWWKINREIRQEILGDPETDPPPTRPGNPMGHRKKLTKLKIKEKMMENIMNGNNKTKTKFYLDNKREVKIGQRAKYMNELNRTEASIIFKARTRMLKMKCNYKKMFQDTVCRLCNQEEENQEHILESCNGVDRHKYGTITITDIFEENPGKLKETARTILKIMELLECDSPQRVERPGRPGQAQQLN